MKLFVDEGITLLVASDGVEFVEGYSLENSKMAAEEAPKQANPAARAKRSAEQLRFRLKEAMAQRGAPEAFLHWLRSDGGKRA
ncbi:MAG: hypothetical protein ACLQGT_00525 [Terracidiphilus sp.]